MGARSAIVRKTATPAKYATQIQIKVLLRSIFLVPSAPLDLDTTIVKDLERPAIGCDASLGFASISKGDRKIRIAGHRPPESIELLHGLS